MDSVKNNMTILCEKFCPEDLHALETQASMSTLDGQSDEGEEEEEEEEEDE